MRALGLVALLSCSVLLGGCAGGTLRRPTPAEALTVEAMCPLGLGSRPETVFVEDGVLEPLSRVKRWVLDTDAEIDWRTFSSGLADAPLDERVAVCVLRKVDGTKLQIRGTGRAVESALVIVRRNGEATTFQLGSVDENLAALEVAFPEGGG